MKRVRVLLLGLLLATISVGIAADPKLPKELALVPPDGLGFISVNVNQLRQHAMYKSLIEGLAKSAFQDDFQRDFGIKIDDLARVTVVLTPGQPFRPDDFRAMPNIAPVFLITSSQPIDKASAIRNSRLEKATDAQMMKARSSAPAGRSTAPPFPGEIVKAPPRQQPVPLPPLSEKVDTDFYFGSGQQAVKFVDDRTIAYWRPPFGGPSNDPRLLNPMSRIKPLFDEGPLQHSLEEAAQHPIAFGFSPQHLLNPLARYTSGLAPYWDVLRADRITGHIKLNPNTADIVLNADYPVGRWAEDAEGTAKQQLRLLARLIRQEVSPQLEASANMAILDKQVRDAATMLMKANVQRKETTVTVTGTLPLDPGMGEYFATIPAAVASSANIAKSSNHLKQMALGMHSYHDVMGTFPLQNDPKTGKPLLSWRVAILPYIEEAALYQQFKHDEPWDSEHNKALIPRMPKLYIVPGAKAAEEGHTYYRSFISKKGQAVKAIFLEGAPRGTGILNITDGTSNSIMFVEAAGSCIWTKPDDIPFDFKGELPKMADHHKKGVFLAAMCDGSVRQVKTNIAAEKLKIAIGIDDGTVTSFDD